MAAKSRQQDLEAAGHDQIAGQMPADLPLCSVGTQQRTVQATVAESPSHNDHRHVPWVPNPDNPCLEADSLDPSG